MARPRYESPLPLGGILVVGGVLVGAALLVAIAILIAVFFPIFSSRIADAQSSLDALQPIVTQQFCYDGCADFFAACTVTPDCTAPTAVAGAGVATECVLGVCVATITLPGGPQIGELGAKLCRESLNDTRGGCLTTVPRVSAGLVEECVAYNGCAAVAWA